jgi:hypothetical protein
MNAVKFPGRSLLTSVSISVHEAVRSKKLRVKFFYWKYVVVLWLFVPMCIIPGPSSRCSRKRRHFIDISIHLHSWYRDRPFPFVAKTAVIVSVYRKGVSKCSGNRCFSSVYRIPHSHSSIYRCVSPRDSDVKHSFYRCYYTDSCRNTDFKPSVYRCINLVSKYRYYVIGIPMHKYSKSIHRYTDEGISVYRRGVFPRHRYTEDICIGIPVTMSIGIPKSRVGRTTQSIPTTSVYRRHIHGYTGDNVRRYTEAMRR